MQVKDQDQSSSRIMFSRVADTKLFPWGREHFIPLANTTTTQSREHSAIELYFQKSTRNKGKDRNRKQNSSPCHLTRSPDGDGWRGGGGGGGAALEVGGWNIYMTTRNCTPIQKKNVTAEKNKTKWNLMLWQI